MTPKQLAGIDALIAYEVLGWRYIRSTFEQYQPSCWYHGDKEVWPREFSPTADIRAAWAVVEALRPHHAFRLTESIGQRDYEACFFDGAGLHYAAAAATVPLAICLAALALKGVVPSA